jgi:hypothetical protein
MDQAPATALVFNEVVAEMERAHKLKADGKFPYVIGENGRDHAAPIFAEELFEVNEAALKVMRTINDGSPNSKLRVELVQVAAICVAWAVSLA